MKCKILKYLYFIFVYFLFIIKTYSNKYYSIIIEFLKFNHAKSMES